MSITRDQVIEDIRRVADELHTNCLSRSEYLRHGRFSEYRIYEDGGTWGAICTEAGLVTKTVQLVSDETYFERLKKAIDKLGRLPRTNERKRHGLNFKKARWPTLTAFIEDAVIRGVLPVQQAQSDRSVKCGRADDVPVRPVVGSGDAVQPHASVHPVPSIPRVTSRRRWEQTGVDGFPYAPHDELGVVALFAIACSRRMLNWQILELRGGKGIDATCYDNDQNREIRVELKFRLSRSSWNHNIDDLDYVVCYENRWRDFPKPVIELSRIFSGRTDGH